MTVRVLPEADAEALDAALWYEDQRTGLGDDFLAERERVIERVEENPGGFLASNTMAARTRSAGC